VDPERARRACVRDRYSYAEQAGDAEDRLDPRTEQAVGVLPVTLWSNSKAGARAGAT